MGIRDLFKTRTVSESDIDAIIDGTYVDDGDDGLAAATDQDIDDIIAGTFRGGR